jgi:hypothetical protein
VHRRELGHGGGANHDDENCAQTDSNRMDGEKAGIARTGRRDN